MDKIGIKFDLDSLGWVVVLEINGRTIRHKLSLDATIMTTDSGPMPIKEAIKLLGQKSETEISSQD